MKGTELSDGVLVGWIDFEDAFVGRRGGFDETGAALELTEQAIRPHAEWVRCRCFLQRQSGCFHVAAREQRAAPLELLEFARECGVRRGAVEMNQGDCGFCARQSRKS